MNKYDAIYEELQYKVYTGELTQEDASILNDIAYEKYSNSRLSEYDLMIEEASTYLSEDIMTLEEVCDIFEITEKAVSNEMLIKAVKKNRTEIRSEVKEIKQLIRSKKYDKAEERIDNLSKNISALKKEVSEYETSLSQDIISFESELLYNVSDSARDVYELDKYIYNTIKSQCDDDISQNSKNKNINAEEIMQAYKIAGCASTSYESEYLIGLITTSKLKGEESNKYKHELNTLLSNASSCCRSMQNKIRRKKKFDEFMKKYNKQIKIGAITAGTVGTVGAGLVAKKILSKKRKNN